jgi:hypothetical protein
LGLTLLLYIVAASLSGAAAGAVLGGAGSLLPLDVRVVVATLLAPVAVCLGGIELAGRRVRPLQCNRETPQRWVRLGPGRWALLNGAALGFGAISRLGFWLWYSLPLGSLLIGDPIVGGAMYGAYALLRSASALGWLIGIRIAHDTEVVSDWLLERASLARAAAAAQLVVIGLVLGVAVGV